MVDLPDLDSLNQFCPLLISEDITEHVVDETVDLPLVRLRSRHWGLSSLGPNGCILGTSLRRITRSEGNLAGENDECQ